MILWAVALLTAVALPALAAPPPNADQSLAPWFQSLAVPSTGGSCCGGADCRNFPVRPAGDHYEVQYGGRWLSVPPEAVLKRTDNPTGDYIVCINGGYYENGESSPKVLCLVKAPGI